MEKVLIPSQFFFYKALLRKIYDLLIKSLKALK